jgi:hypothetical protein
MTTGTTVVFTAATLEEELDMGLLVAIIGVGTLLVLVFATFAVQWVRRRRTSKVAPDDREHTQSPRRANTEAWRSKSVHESATKGGYSNKASSHRLGPNNNGDYSNHASSRRLGRTDRWRGSPERGLENLAVTDAFTYVSPRQGDRAIAGAWQVGRGSEDLAAIGDYTRTLSPHLERAYTGEGTEYGDDDGQSELKDQVQSAFSDYKSPQRHNTGVERFNTGVEHALYDGEDRLSRDLSHYTPTRWERADTDADDDQLERADTDADYAELERGDTEADYANLERADTEAEHVQSEAEDEDLHHQHTFSTYTPTPPLNQPATGTDITYSGAVRVRSLPLESILELTPAPRSSTALG